VSKLDGFDLMLLQNAKTPSNLAWLLERLPGSVWKQEKRSLLIRLDRYANWDAYAAALPKRLMADQRRQWRRLDQAAFDVVDEAADIAPTIDFIIEHKLVWLASRGIAAANFGTPEYRSFLNAAANDALASGSLVLARLFAGDKLVSAAFALKRATELTFLMFAYDFAWEKYSPSRLLLERTIQWCYANGVALFDFLPGGDYKELWTNDDVVATTYMIPTTARGYAIRKWYLADVASTLERSWVKKVYRHLPAPVRHAIYRMLAKRKLVGLDFIRKMEAM
jgi:CelD/BcsL family acetyltransferase involved in cellulose biosynthesis